MEAVPNQGAVRLVVQSPRVRLWTLGLVVITVLLLWQGQEINPSGGRGSADELVTFPALVLFFAALVCEYVDSSLGMGYGTILTPLLMLAGYSAAAIVPCLLLSELVTGICAAAMHQRDGNVDFLQDPDARRTAGLLSALSVVGAVLAVALALRLPAAYSTLGVGVIVLGAGTLVLLTRNARLRYRRRHIVLLGLLAAFNKSFSGGGYGPLVTAGQVVSGVAARKAVAITSLAESFTCLVGLVTYLAIRPELDWSMAIMLTSGALMSVPIATMTVKWMPENRLRLLVGLLTVCLGLVTLAKAFGKV
jgi:hypothetical protein